MREALQDAFSWYNNEGLPQWNACQESEDLGALRSLQEEAEQVRRRCDAAPYRLNKWSSSFPSMTHHKAGCHFKLLPVFALSGASDAMMRK